MKFFANAIHKIIHRKIIIGLCIFLGLTTASGWYTASNSIPIDLDELAWIQDAQVYQWRITNNWKQFHWDQTKKSMDWTTPDFRLFDQPHFAKYIYGFALSTTNTDPWQNTNRENNFRLFIEQKFTGQYFLTDSASSSIFGQSTIEAIQLCRWISILFSASALLSLFFFLTYKFSLLMSSITILLLTSNPTIFYNLHLATGDSISLFCIFVSLILFYFLLIKNHLTRRTRFAMLLLSALSTACAVSTKINGWLLIYIFSIGIIILSHQKQLNSWKNLFSQLCLWILFFLGTYMYLQPELWNSIPNGLIRFFSQRLTQQQQFVQSFGTLGFFTYHKWIFDLTVQSNNLYIQIVKTMLFILAIMKLVYMLVTNFPIKLLIKKLAIFCLPVWLFFFYISRVGFERYAIWPVIIFSILCSWILTRQNSLSEK